MEDSHIAASPKEEQPLEARLDESLLAYLSAYEEYTTCHLEMQAQLRDGQFALSRARRDLSRSTTGGTALGEALFPGEIQPLVVVRTGEGEEGGEPPPLEYVFCEDGARVLNSDDDVSSDGDDAIGEEGPACDADPDRATMAALERMGVSSDMQRRIANAVRDDGEDVAVAVGNSLAIEKRSGTMAGSGRGAAYQARSEMTFSAGGIEDLKRAQFRAALSASDAAEGAGNADRPKPQVRPRSNRDPLQWFTLLPPPSLRQGQKSFRRAAETAVQCAAAQAKMSVARREYEELLQASASQSVGPK